MLFYSDDPVRDADRYDRYQEARLAELPECCECGYPIQGEVYGTDYGEKLCEECWNTFYREDDDDE